MRVSASGTTTLTDSPLPDLTRVWSQLQKGTGAEDSEKGSFQQEGKNETEFGVQKPFQWKSEKVISARRKISEKYPSRGKAIN